METTVKNFVVAKDALKDFMKSHEEVFLERKELMKQVKETKNMVLEYMRENKISEHEEEGYTFRLTPDEKLHHDNELLESIFDDQKEKVQNYLNQIREEKDKFVAKKRKRN